MGTKMKENVNFQLELDKILKKISEQIEEENNIPTLLLHSCCAPCSSYVLEYLSQFFAITVFYYNPNISEEFEYRKRVEEQKRLIKEMTVKYPVTFIEGTYNPSEYDKAVSGLEHLGERSRRCYECYQLRLAKTAVVAKQNNFDYFTTTLSISPYKNAVWLNEIGMALEEEINIKYLCADFKKRNGYKRSIELSSLYQLYRQDFCGCKYSKEEELNRKKSMMDK
ncbi:MAG: epoxyqueuosine reductase QueH [Lachnospiraceae bacterium]